MADRVGWTPDSCFLACDVLPASSSTFLLTPDSGIAATVVVVVVVDDPDPLGKLEEFADGVDELPCEDCDGWSTAMPDVLGTLVTAVVPLANDNGLLEVVVAVGADTSLF